MKLRTMSVSGSFYPSDSNDVQFMIEDFNRKIPEEKTEMSLTPKALIVPHAGWIYSGYTANLAFRMIHNTKPKRYIVIGPSHRVGFDGISISDMDYYMTPSGNITIDHELVDELKKRFSLECYPEAHHEHSTEVQMPFIHHYSPDAKVIELVYAYTLPQRIMPIITYALGLKDTIVVISTDLSHFHTLESAHSIDGVCIESIRNLDLHILDHGCEACGILGVEAILGLAREQGLKSQILDYRTSADASGDTSRVVGYVSAVFY